jgi:hypothetical protein
MVGNLILFFFTLAAVIVVGQTVLSYAAHCFLTALVGTAAGADEVHWPDESITDWLGDPYYLAWIAALPLAAAWAILYLAAPELLQEDSGALLVGAGAALLYPILLLSSLGSASRWQFLNREVLRRLAHHLGALVVFYFLSEALLVASVYLIINALFRPNWLLLLIAVPPAAALWLIYARLLGRIAWLAGFRTPGRAIAKKKKKRSRPPRARAAEVAWSFTEQTPPMDPVPTTGGNVAPAITVLDPWAVPEDAPAREAPAPASSDEEEDEWGPQKPYGVMSDEHAKAAWKRRIPQRKSPPVPIADDEEENEWTPNKKPYALADDIPYSQRKKEVPKPQDLAMEPADDEDEWTTGKKPYGLMAAPRQPAPSPLSEAITGNGPTQHPGSDAVTNEDHSARMSLEQRLFLGRQEQPPPRFALFSGVWSFPFYGTSRDCLAYLTLSGIVWGGMIRFLLMLWPSF